MITLDGFHGLVTCWFLIGFGDFRSEFDGIVDDIRIAWDPVSYHHIMEYDAIAQVVFKLSDIPKSKRLEYEI